MEVIMARRTRGRLFTLFKFFPVWLFILTLIQPALPCTVAVISAKASREGRPLLWKNRDTSAENNIVIYIQGKKFGIIALVNATDPGGRNVWAGCNSAGFAIMNSASGDLTKGLEGMAQNGAFMRRALEECATVLDFENLLQQTNGQRKVGANFGVIDALGNACFFETSSDSYTKFDANDPRVAPDGYIVRTNYAFTAPTPYTGGGYIRFERISHLFQQAAAEKSLSIPFILQQAARDLVNEKIHSFPLAQPLPPGPQPLYINTNDTINRNSTQAVTLFVGAPSPEKAYLTTMWVMLGQPICTVALPLWAGMNKIPEVLTGENGSVLNHHSQLIEAYLYPDRRGHMTQYLNLSRFLTYRGQGVLPFLLEIEHEILARAREMEANWLSKPPSPAKINQAAAELAQWAWEKFQENFPLEAIK